MRSKRSIALISFAAVALAACTTAASPSAPVATQAAPATLAASAVAEASPSPSAVPSSEPEASSAGGGSQATPGSTDPCSLLTAAEASTAMGKKLSDGVSATLDPDRVCTFKAGLSEVKVILAPPAPSATAAQAYWDEARSQVPAGVSVKDLSDFDRSAYGSGSAGGVSLSGLFVIDGTNFFEFYCGFPSCSETASLAAAHLIAGRLP